MNNTNKNPSTFVNGFSFGTDTQNGTGLKDKGVIEAAQSMGASTWTIVYKVLLGEARTSLLVGVTIAIGTILGYSAMAGVVGGGGLGDIAIRYGYYRYQADVMLVTIVILVALVQILQGIGMMISKKIDKRKA